MKNKFKMLPVVLMLIAGAATGIITYVLNYESKTALLILLGVLLFFYVAGCLFRNMILRFEKEQDEKEKARLEKEGKVLEKEQGEDISLEADEKKELKDTGEQ